MRASFAKLGIVGMICLYLLLVSCNAIIGIISFQTFLKFVDPLVWIQCLLVRLSGAANVPTDMAVPLWQDLDLVEWESTHTIYIYMYIYIICINMCLNSRLLTSRKKPSVPLRRDYPAAGAFHDIATLTPGKRS